MKQSTNLLILLLSIILFSCSNSDTPKNPAYTIQKAKELKAKADTNWMYIEGSEEMKLSLILDLLNVENTPFSKGEKDVARKQISDLQKTTLCQSCIADISLVDKHDKKHDDLINNLTQKTNDLNDEFIDKIMEEIEYMNVNKLIKLRTDYEESVSLYNTFLDSNLTFLQKNGFDRLASFSE